MRMPKVSTVVISAISLTFSSSPVYGRRSQDGYVVFLGPGGGTDGRSAVLSLPDFSTISTNMKPHPFKKIYPSGRGRAGINGVVAAVVDGSVMVCGGITPHTAGTKPDWSDKCYTLMQGEDWAPAPDMIKERAYAAAAQTQAGWWVTGGSNDTSTEILVNGKWETGPSLPMAMAGHCLIQLNSRQHLLVGGATELGRNEFRPSRTYLLQDGGYVEVDGGPVVVGAACAKLGQDAYVVGGANPLTQLATSKVHIWSSVGWKDGPELPAPIYSASLVAYDNHLYLLGGLTMKTMDSQGAGYNKIIYKLDGGEWTAVRFASPASGAWRWSFPALVATKQIVQ